MTSTFLGTIAVSCSGFWLVRRSLAPLRGLAEQTRALQIDGLGNRLALDRPVEELQPWIEQFNELLGRLDYGDVTSNVSPCFLRTVAPHQLGCDLFVDL